MRGLGRGPEGEDSPSPRAVSSAPVVCLLRILERAWKERALLSADLVERIREQLEGPLGLKAKADERVLDILDGFEPEEFMQLAELSTAPGQRLQLARLAKAVNECRRIRP